MCIAIVYFQGCEVINFEIKQAVFLHDEKVKTLTTLMSKTKI